MNNIYLGLSLWAWLGYIFLVLSGIFLGIASTNSTKLVVDKGVDSILAGTENQLQNMTDTLVNPKRTLNSYLVNIHKPLHNELLNKILMNKQLENVIKEKRKGNNILKGGENISILQLESAKNDVKTEITKLSNRYYASIETLRDLTKKTKITNLIETFKVYDKLNQEIINTSGDENNSTLKEIETKVALSKSIFDSVITQTE